MKQQVSRLSPHQTAKVMAVMSAVTTLIFIIPFVLITSLLGGSGGSSGREPPSWLFLLLPIFYLIFGYICTVIGCAIYNLLVPFTGGIEYDVTPAA